MADKKKRTVALCISGVEPQYQCVILDSVCHRCRELDMNLAVFYSMTDNIGHTMEDAGETDIYSLPNYELFDGLIILGRQFSNDILTRVTDNAKKNGTPVVTISRDIKDCYSVSFEYGHCIKTMVRHFYAKHGFTHINYMCGLESNIDDARLNGFKEAMAEFGLPFDESNIGFGKYDTDIIEEELRRFMSSEDPPQAIICVNDTTAILVCESLSKMRYNVPEDVCVSGFDGICEARDASPKITTAGADAVMAAIKSVDILNDVLSGMTCPHMTILPLIYDFTESCGCRRLDTSHNHSTIHKLYTQISESTDFSKRILKLNETMTNLKTYEEVKQKITESVKKCWSTKSWLCICEDYFLDKTPDIYDDYIDDRRGYSSRMEPYVHVIGDEAVQCENFDTKDLLPDFENEMNECKTLMFAPLHALGRTIGYFAMDYTPAEKSNVNLRNFGFLHNWLMTISVILENIRIQTELTSYARRINQLYITDPLTGLYNRRGFYQLIKKDILEKCTNGSSVIVISSDLDNLKTINDVYGHTEGDFAITSAACALCEAAGSNGIAARFGGDEFVAFIACSDTDDAETLIEKLNDVIDRINETSGKPYRIGVSAGYAATTISDDFSIDSLISKADASMYSVKSKHKAGRPTAVSDIVAAQ